MQLRSLSRRLLQQKRKMAQLRPTLVTSTVSIKGACLLFSDSEGGVDWLDLLTFGQPPNYLPAGFCFQHHHCQFNTGEALELVNINFETTLDRSDAYSQCMHLNLPLSPLQHFESREILHCSHTRVIGCFQDEGKPKPSFPGRV